MTMDIKHQAQRKSLVNIDASPAPVKCYVTVKAWPKGHLAGSNFRNSPSSGFLEHVVHASVCIDHGEMGFEAYLTPPGPPVWPPGWTQRGPGPGHGSGSGGGEVSFRNVY